MPMYAYVCPECGKYVELTRSTDERNDDADCAYCGALLKRKWGVGGVYIR